MTPELKHLHTLARWFMNAWSGGDYHEQPTDGGVLLMAENDTHPPRRWRDEPVRFAVAMPMELPMHTPDGMIPPSEPNAPVVLVVSSVESFFAGIARLKSMGIIPAEMCPWITTEPPEDIPDELPVVKNPFYDPQAYLTNFTPVTD